MPLLPTEGLLSSDAVDALELYRSRSDASTVAAADVVHVEDLLRRAQAADNRLTHQAVRHAISAGRLGIAGTLLLSQAYAPSQPVEQQQQNDSAVETRCWCGDVIDAKSSPDGAVGCLGGHAMHAPCAADLLLGGGSCPTCRQPIFFSKVAGPEAKAAIEFAKEEIQQAQKESQKRVRLELEDLAEFGIELSFEVGDVVLVSPDLDVCRIAQTKDPIAGGWDDDMAPACGLEGRVTGIVKDGEHGVSVRVRSMGRHVYKKILHIDDFQCPRCRTDGPSPHTFQKRCRNCSQCESCCRRTIRSCPETTHEWNWNPLILTLLRRSGNLGMAHETSFENESSAAIGRAEKHIICLRGEFIAVKKSREAVKEATDKFISNMGVQILGLQKMSRELSTGSSAAFSDMAASGVSPPDWQRARHLLLLARQWGNSVEAMAKRESLYNAVRHGDLDSVGRIVRGYNADNMVEAAKWTDATKEPAQYVVEPFAHADLRAFPNMAAPKTGYNLTPLSEFTTKHEVLDRSGNLWLQVGIPSIGELASLEGKLVTVGNIRSSQYRVATRV